MRACEHPGVSAWVCHSVASWTGTRTVAKRRKRVSLTLSKQGLRFPVIQLGLGDWVAHVGRFCSSLRYPGPTLGLNNREELGVDSSKPRELST